MTDIRALAERIVNLPYANNDARRLARRLLAILDAADGMREAFRRHHGPDPQMEFVECNCSKCRAISIYDAAVSGEREDATPDPFGFKRPFQPSEPEPYDPRYPPDGQGVA